MKNTEKLLVRIDKNLYEKNLLPAIGLDKKS